MIFVIVALTMLCRINLAFTIDAMVSAPVRPIEVSLNASNGTAIPLENVRPQ